jgi:alkanesulfonate monooxygenase SsuD/methylene tetrahydromethanopterin reductase-like flavin-dependent oxidoreductase (luciferase family)
MAVIGLKLSPQNTTISALRRVWAIADEAGFEGCWVFDHFAALRPDPAADVFEGWTLLAAMAEATRRVRIGCLVTGNTYRHPAVLAKMAATVDHLSGGRLDLGLGAGGGMEHAMFGLPYERPVGHFAEALRILKLLWTEEVTTFEGEHYRLTEAVANPKPIQRPGPPLWLGAVGERRSLRLAAEHADVWTPSVRPGADPAELGRLGRVLDRHCADLGRDPKTLRRAVQLLLPADPDEALRTAQAHVDEGFTDLIILCRDEPGAHSTAALLPRLQSL